MSTVILPYGVDDLRCTCEVTKCTVTCHVRGCERKVDRQRGSFRKKDGFLCPDYGIYLSPSTFEYQDPWRNLIWQDQADRVRMAAIRKVKRTAARLGRERDEDALTWNVVRAFHREDRLRRLAQVLLAGSQFPLPESEPEIVYWSSDMTGSRWPPLSDAQSAFREARNRGTEPDVALWWPEKCLIFLEAKLAPAIGLAIPPPTPTSTRGRQTTAAILTSLRPFARTMRASLSRAGGIS